MEEEIENQEPQGTTIDNWDVDINPATLHWASEEDRQDAQDYYDGLHPPKYDGYSYPGDKFDWDSLEQQEEALEKWKARQVAIEQGNMRAYAEKMAVHDHPAETDKNFFKKKEVAEQLMEQVAKQQRLENLGDTKAAREAEGRIAYLEKELQQLDSERAEREAAEQGEKIAADRRHYIEKHMKDDALFELQKSEIGAETLAEHSEVYCQQANEKSSDGTLHYVAGNSKHGLDPGFKLRSVQLTPERKKAILDIAGRGVLTVYDILRRHELVPEFVVEYPKGTKFEDKRPEDMTQEQYEKWREKNDPRAKPKYPPMF
jgi:hypothetical protein